MASREGGVEVARTERLDPGRVQIYTGDGKGKTTAALGLALRAMGQGLDVLFLQFGKDLRCAEHVEAERIGLKIWQGEGEDLAERAASVLARAREVIRAGEVDLLVLDEVGEALRQGWLTTDDVAELCLARPGHMELVMTGRNLGRIYQHAHLITEMRCVRHYYDEGLLARKGIEW